MTTESTPLVKPGPTILSNSWKTWLIGLTTAVAIGGVVYLATRPVVNDSSSYCDSVSHEFGYIQLPHKVNDHYFYSFFESRSNPSTDPLVLWLEGGPGSSSTWTLFNVNGPCTINEDLEGTTLNPNSWTNHANVIWLDQPTGVGFSYGDVQDDDGDEIDVGRNVYAFMQGWLKKYPQYQKSPFYIIGQSYGGHYVPAAAHYIVQEQKNQLSADTIRLNLQGIAIGNGITDTVIQFPMVVGMIDSVAEQYNVTLVSAAEAVQIKETAKSAIPLLEKCQLSGGNQSCLDALDIWQKKLLDPMLAKSHRNPYDVREVCSPKCNDYGMAKTTKYLNLPHVQNILGVHKPFAWNNATVAAEFAVDIGKTVVHMIPPILDSGVRVLLYVGDADLMCDWKGNDAWAKNLLWPGHDAYNAAPVKPFIVDKRDAGQVRSSHGLTFVRVFESGHGVPVDQPLVGLALIDRFFNNKSFT